MTKEEINNPDLSKTDGQETGNKANVYEIGYLLVSSVSKEEALAEVSKIKDILAKQETVFLSGDEPKLIELAYPMSKTVDTNKKIYEDAYFGWLKFEADPEALIELKKQFDNYTKILRYLLIKTTAKDSFISDSKKFVIGKKDFVDAEKTIEPIKIVEKDSEEASPIEEIERTEEEEKELDETIDNLIV
ncbi:MAG: 30S ribosomal protein S6 [Patescibacteria group bacterium]